MKVYLVRKTITRTEVRKVWATDEKAAEATASLDNVGWLVSKQESVKTETLEGLPVKDS
jgi:hypothetical protein